MSRPRGRPRKIDPLGDQFLDDHEHEEADESTRSSADEVPATVGDEITILRGQVIDLKAKLENAQAELEIERARADAAEAQIKDHSAPRAFNPNVPHVVKEAFRSVMPGGSGTMFLTAGQVLTDPYKIKMAHVLGAQLVPQ